MTSREESRRARRPRSWSRSPRRSRFIVGLVVILALVGGVALTPAHAAAYILAPVGGAVLTMMAAGAGRRRTLVSVWHDAQHPDGVERRLLGVAATPGSAARLASEATTLPGFRDSAGGISVQPEAIGVLETSEVWRLVSHRRRARLDNQIGHTAWFLTDAEEPTLLLPGESALGFATTQESALRVADARRRESLREPASVRAVELPVGRILWPQGVTITLTAARPLVQRDGSLSEDVGVPPSIDRTLLDPLGDPYRDRAGRISRQDGTPVAEIYLQTEVHWKSVGGLGRVWLNPSEAIHGYEAFADGTFTDFVLIASDLTDEIHRWNEGTWTLDGDVMKVQWLDDEATEAYRTGRGYARPRY